MDGLCGARVPMEYGPKSAIERLDEQELELEQRLKKIKVAKGYLKANPEFQEFLSCIRDVGCL